MKLLLFIDSLGSGGAQRQLVEIGKGFKEKGHKVSFLTYHDINFFKPELDAANIPVKTIVEPNYLKRIFKVRKAIRKEKPNAVLSFLEAANFMATLAGFPYRKWKLVVGERSANPRILKSKKLRIYRWFHLFPDYVVGNSLTNLKMVYSINSLLSQKKGKVIYNMVNIPDLRDNDFEVSHKINLVIAASIYPVKNFDGLIEAIRLLSSECQSKLIVNWYGRISNHGYYKEILELIKQYHLESSINIHPPVINIFQKYMEADFVGLFSHFEGFPNTISEAMALGKPVIASKVSDIPLLLKTDKNGFLCDAEDPNSIKTALEKAIDSSIQNRKTMGHQNRVLAKENFGKRKIIAAYLKLLAS